MSQIEANKALVRRYFDERWNTRNYSIVDELDGGPDADIDGHKAWLEELNGAFSESHLTLGDMIAEDDRVALHYTFDGVMCSAYQGLGSHGEHVTFSGIAMLRITDGKIVDDIAYSDGFGAAISGQTYEPKMA